MKQKAIQQPDVLETINRNIFLSEEKRRQLRFEYNLAALAVGSVRVLGSNEFVADLAAFLANGLEEKDKNQKILSALGEAAVCPDRMIRERTLTVLSLVALNSLQENDRGEIVLLVHIFSHWLEYEQEVLPGLAVICQRIEELSDWLLQKSLWEDAEKIVGLLARIHCGGLGKSAAIRSLIGKSLSKLATQSAVEKLIDGYLQNDNELYLGILRSLGIPSAGFLFRKILQSSDRKERQQLLNLVWIVAGEAFPDLVEDALQQHPAAEALQDIIHFAAENNGVVIYQGLQRCLTHEDKRVQQEMIRYIVKLGGREMKARLMAGLGVVHDSLKITIIRLLAEHAGGDESVLAALCEFIDSRNDFAPNARQGLVRAVVIALRTFPHRQSIEVLDRLHHEYEKLANNDRLRLQIDRSIKILTPQLRHNRQFPDDTGEVFFDSDPVHKQLARNKIAKIEEEVRKTLRLGDSKGAGQLLYQHARTAGQERDFVAAEILRDRILEVNPMALIEVVELGNWLENQKKALTEPLHSDTWRNLGELLAPVEFKALHHALRRESYRKGDLIIQAGESDESLYFLTSGHIGLNCLSGGDERFLKRMKPGDILGSTPFFAASVWTFSLRALSDVHVHLLKRESFRLLVEKFPELEQKLHNFCTKYEEMIAELLKTTGDDRREFPRYPTIRLITNCLHDPYGAGESRAFNGELVDISRNGLAFTVKISGRENARLLLGREISSTIQADGQSIAQCSGIVVGVRQRNGIAKDFSIHVKLARQIDDVTFNRIVFPIDKQEQSAEALHVRSTTPE
ncbi:MAG: hypothetical protein A2X81_18910 [Desulfobacterales bacterium GWB2_56_26]|nr:MAG: hypothetical protein A2X81_18910 [Desulfobacterales bacterium GWB2_56_26]